MVREGRKVVDVKFCVGFVSVDDDLGLGFDLADGLDFDEVGRGLRDWRADKDSNSGSDSDVDEETIDAETEGGGYEGGGREMDSAWPIVGRVRARQPIFWILLSSRSSLSLSALLSSDEDARRSSNWA